MNPLETGGRAGMTKRLRIMYGKYNVDQQTQGLEALDWPLWLEQNGYRLEADGLVNPVGEDELNKIIDRARYS